MPKDILIRAVPDETAKEIEILAAQADQSRNDYLVGLLNDVANDHKPAALRWLDLTALPGHRGEVDWTEMECIECGGDLDNRPFYALMSDSTLHGPACAGCATSD